MIYESFAIHVGDPFPRRGKDSCHANVGLVHLDQEVMGRTVSSGITLDRLEKVLPIRLRERWNILPLEVIGHVGMKERDPEEEPKDKRCSAINDAERNSLISRGNRCR